MSGKVFRTKAHKRQKNEKYYTPAWATEAVMPYIPGATTAPFFPLWWEPAAGAGDISAVLLKWGQRVMSSDIEPGDPTIAQSNFLTERKAPEGCRVICTNPPFGTGGRLAFQFCWHALRLMEPVKGKVVMLLRDDYDSAGGRTALFGEHPSWHQKIVLTERIRWVNLPQSTEHGPSGSHAWFIWDWGREPGPATLHYTGRRS